MKRQAKKAILFMTYIFIEILFWIILAWAITSVVLSLMNKDSCPELKTTTKLEKVLLNDLFCEDKQ